MLFLRVSIALVLAGYPHAVEAARLAMNASTVSTTRPASNTKTAGGGGTSSIAKLAGGPTGADTITPEQAIEALLTLEQEALSTRKFPNEGVQLVFDLFRNHEEERQNGMIDPFLELIGILTALQRSNPGSATLKCGEAKALVWLLTKWRLDTMLKLLANQAPAVQKRVMNPVVECKFYSEVTCNHLHELAVKCPTEYPGQLLWGERRDIFDAYVRLEISNSARRSAAAAAAAAAGIATEDDQEEAPPAPSGSGSGESGSEGEVTPSGKPTGDKPARPRGVRHRLAGPLLPATRGNGWLILGQGNEGEPLPKSDEKARTSSCSRFRSLLESGGAAVVRVGVSDDFQRTTPQRALWYTLLPKQRVTLRKGFDAWNTPLEAAITEDREGAYAAYDRAAEARMDDMVERMGEALGRLNEDLPEDFGAVWVLTMVEQERQAKTSYRTEPKFGIASFRYIGENEDAKGAGGVWVDSATQRLSALLPDMVKTCWDDTYTTVPLKSTQTPATNPHQLMREVYARTFSYASQHLSRLERNRMEMDKQDLTKFVADCKKSLERGAIYGTCNIAKANDILTQYDRGSEAMTATMAFTLSQFLQANGGVISREQAREKQRRKREAILAAEEARKNFEEKQAGPDAIPEAGKFGLSDGSFAPVLSLFFEDSLSKGKWICFQLKTEQNADFQVFEGSGKGGPASEFWAWQAALQTGDGRPLSTANVHTIEAHTLRTSMASFSESRRERYDEAMEKLRQVDQPQTLCAHRFQVPVKSHDEAAKSRPDLFDVPTTWAGNVPVKEAMRMVASPKALAMKAWLLNQKVILSDFLCDMSADNEISYERAVAKAKKSR